MDYSRNQINRLSDLVLKDIISNRLYIFAAKLAWTNKPLMADWIRRRTEEAINGHNGYIDLEDENDFGIR